MADPKKKTRKRSKATRAARRPAVKAASPRRVNARTLDRGHEGVQLAVWVARRAGRAGERILSPRKAKELADKLCSGRRYSKSRADLDFFRNHAMALGDACCHLERSAPAGVSARSVACAKEYGYALCAYLEDAAKAYDQIQAGKLAPASAEDRLIVMYKHELCPKFDALLEETRIKRVK